MGSPLHAVRFLATGEGRVLREAAALLEMLGAEVVRVGDLAGPVHAARSGEIDAAGALDASGRLGDPPFPVVRLAPDPGRGALPGEGADAWAKSGAAALTGDPDAPPYGAPGVLVERVLAAGAVVQLLAACRGVALDLDPVALLGERAALAGFGRRGTTSVGGACEVVAASDGWIAVNVARPEDVEALPALVDGEARPGDWRATCDAIARRPRAELVERAALLGLPLAAWPGPDGVAVASPYRVDRAEPRRRVSGGGASGAMGDAPQRPLVVDLTSLWAGPLATSLMEAAGARVVKVEGRRRPDGARRGPAAFFDLLNAGKECLALDFDDEADRALLRSMIRRADLVVEGSRPRVMAALGIDPAEVVRAGRTSWISITGHGREGEAAARVAFGDDAAFEGGCTVDEPPRFVADAVADPIAGLYAAAAGLAALVGSRGNVFDVALARAAAYARGRGGARGERYDPTVPVAPPRARDVHRRASAHGAHSDSLRAEFGYGRPA
jgi:hypothetical protein